MAGALEHAQRRVRRALQVLGVAVRRDHERRHVPGVREADARVILLHDEVEQRGHLPAVEAPHHAVQAVEHAARRVPLERVRAHRVPELPHQRGGADPVAHDVPHRHPDAAAVERDRVVPVAAHVRSTGHVAGRHLDAVERRKAVGQEAPLEHLHVRQLALVRARVLDREPGAVGHQHQQALVLEREAARRPRTAHLHHPREPALHHERAGHQRGDARRPPAAGSSPRPPRSSCERHRAAALDHLLERAAEHAPARRARPRSRRRRPR